MPTAIWYLIGIVLSLLILVIVGWLVMVAITYPQRKRNFDKMKKDFDESWNRVTTDIKSDRKRMGGF